MSRFRSAVASAQSADTGTTPVAEAVALPADPTDSVATEAITPVDWAALLAVDPATFFKWAQEQVKQWKQEILRRLDNGASPTNVLQWLNEIVFPEIGRIFHALGSVQRGNRSLSAVHHDLGHQLLDLKRAIAEGLRRGDAKSIRDVKLLCDTDSRLVELLHD